MGTETLVVEVLDLMPQDQDTASKKACHLKNPSCFVGPGVCHLPSFHRSSACLIACRLQELSPCKPSIHPYVPLIPEKFSLWSCLACYDTGCHLLLPAPRVFIHISISLELHFFPTLHILDNFLVNQCHQEMGVDLRACLFASQSTSLKNSA